MAEMSGMGGMSGISGIVSSVTSALTSLDPKAGASAIEQVLGALKNLPGTEAIQGSLTSLHQQLTSGSPDGSKIGSLMRELSSQTRGVAGQAGPIGGGLTQLADRLQSAAGQVSGGASA